MRRSPPRRSRRRRSTATFRRTLAEFPRLLVPLGAAGAPLADLLVSTLLLALLLPFWGVLPGSSWLLVPLILSHRIILKPEAELRGRTAYLILEDVLEKTPLDLGSPDR